MSPALTPEQLARVRIDADLVASGWVVQSRDEINLRAAQGVAVRELPLRAGYGRVDYLLFVDERPVGVLEAKPEGHPLSGAEPQTRLYSKGIPVFMEAPVDPLPFLYRSTGALTALTNLLDPNPKSRPIFQIQRPQTLAEWLLEPPVRQPGAAGKELNERQSTGRPVPGSLRAHLRALPEADLPDLWPNQQQAIRGLERSLREDRPRALIQMATGSGKTMTAITAAYRLIQHGGARRILFLVDRTNLGEQAEREFAAYVTPDDHRKPGYRRDLSPGVCRERRVLPEDHLQDDGQETEGSDPGLPDPLPPEDRGDGRHDRDRYGHPADRDRDVPPRGQEPPLLRADEGARRADDRAG